MTLGVRLKEMRDKRGLLQREVADAVGVSTGSISFYEKGIKNPSQDVLTKLANFYGVTTDYLLKGETIDIEESFPEGIQLLRRAKEELSEKDLSRMIKMVKSFLDEA